MRQTPFTRPTLLAAVELLERHTQARFNQLVLRLGLEQAVPSATSVSVAAKTAILGRVVLEHPTDVIQTVDGSVTLAEAVVREAVRLLRRDYSGEQDDALTRGLARDGYVVSWDQGDAPTLRAALPAEVDLPATDDEVHRLLTHFNFVVPAGHLGQAIEAHTRGDWAAANSQLRTFLESLFDDLARAVKPTEAAQRPTSENRRALLADSGFLSIARNEWTHDGKSFVNGLFKMLHTDGSHPGLSDEDHSTFRLHVVLVTARTFLRRLHNQR